MSDYKLTTPPAHRPLFLWGDAGAKTGKYRLKTRYGSRESFKDIFVEKIQKYNNFYVSISDRGTARFSQSAAKACAVFVQKKIRANAYASMVPALSKKWAARKKKLGLAHQVGMATEQLVNNITAFRTNISDKSFKETKHTGYVVGVNQIADREDDVISKKSEKKYDLLYPGKKKRKKGEKDTRKTKNLHRWGSDFLNAKLWWLEHGKKNRGHGRATGVKVPRPVYTKAVEEFIRSEFSKDFVGQLIKDSVSGKLAFKYKANK